MIIEEVSIRAFGRLSGVHMTFDRRMNIIEGENESGKSTLAAFIRYMLYGFSGRAAAGEVTEKKKRVAWESGRAEGTMTVATADGRYRIERATVAVTSGVRENFRDTVAVIDLSNNTPLPGAVSPGERFLGVPEEVFLRTAFVAQLDSPRVDGQELTKAIENLLFTGDETLNVPRALEKLDGLRRVLLYKNGKGGEIYDLSAQRDALAADLAKAEEENAAILARENDLCEAERLYAEAEKTYRETEERRRVEENAVLVAAYDRLKSARAEHAAAEEALRDLCGMPAYRMHDEDLTALALRRAEMQTARARYEAARDTRIALSGKTDLTPEEETHLDRAERAGGVAELSAAFHSVRRRGGVWLTLAVVAAVLGLCATVAALLLRGGVWFPLIAAGGAVLFLFAAAACLPLHRARRDARALYADYDTDARHFVERLRGIEDSRRRRSDGEHAAAEAGENEGRCLEDYNRTLAELDNVVNRFGRRLPQEGIDEFVRAVEEDARQVLARKTEYEGTRVSSEATIQALEERLHGCTGEEEARAGLPVGYEPDVSRLNPEETRKRAEYYREQRDALARRRADTREEIAHLRARVGNPAALSAELCTVEERLRLAQEQHAACVMAEEAIQGAGERLRAQISPRLSAFAGRMVGALTEGKYPAVGVGSDLSLTVGDTAAAHAVDYMSAGTQDLTYLSLRMALIDLLYRREKPPVCFDESFAHQDDRRAARMIEALYTLSAEGQQNFIFTCHPREGRMATEAGLPDVRIIRMA